MHTAKQYQSQDSHHHSPPGTPTPTSPGPMPHAHLGAQLWELLAGRGMGDSGQAGLPRAHWSRSLVGAGRHIPYLGWA